MVARRHWRTSAVAVLAAALAACAGGCSGERAGAEEAAPGGDTITVLHGAADRLVRAGTSKAQTSMEMATGGTRVTIRGSGVYDYRERLGRLKVLLPEDPAGAREHRPITELLAPGALFMKNRGAGVPADKWVRVDIGTLSDGNLVTGGVTDPYAAAEVLRGARTATYLGRTEVAGTPVRHYRGTADLALAAREASGVNRGPFTAAAKGFATAEVPFDVYLDEEGRVRKIRQRFSFVGGQAKNPVAVASTALLYDFGVGVDVRLPRGPISTTGKLPKSDWRHAAGARTSPSVPCAGRVPLPTLGGR